MDIRILEYYLTVVREGSITAAARALHMTQPSLSRQLRDLEDELGTALFERGSRRIRLTEEGILLRRRAEEMVRLLQITENEIRQSGSRLSGEVHIGAGESLAFHYLSQAAGKVRRAHPGIRFTVTSGDTADLMDQLENGLLDLALVFTGYDQRIYQGLRLPESDRLGLLMRKDDPLAEKKAISDADLVDLPILIPRAAGNLFASDPVLSGLPIVTVYNLIFNASLLVEDGVGYAIGFDKLIRTDGGSPLTFRPLARQLHQTGTVIWKKYQVQPPAVHYYLECLKEMV